MSEKFVSSGIKYTENVIAEAHMLKIEKRLLSKKITHRGKTIMSYALEIPECEERERIGGFFGDIVSEYAKHLEALAEARCAEFDGAERRERVYFPAHNAQMKFSFGEDGGKLTVDCEEKYFIGSSCIHSGKRRFVFDVVTGLLLRYTRLDGKGKNVRGKEQERA